MELTQQGENAGKEIFNKSKLSLTPMRKVASYVGRLCEEGKDKVYYFIDMALSHQKAKKAFKNNAAG